MKEGSRPFVPNPAFAGLMGLCLIVAASDSLADGIILGLGAALSSIALAAIVPPLGSALPGRLKAPFSLVVASTLGLLYRAGVWAIAPAIARGVDVYLLIMCINCLGLHSVGMSSAESGRNASRGSIVVTLREALGFLAATASIGGIRELVGLGTLTLPRPGMEAYRLIFTDEAPLRLLASPAGGFMLMGFMVAVYRSRAVRASRRRA